MPRCRRQGWRPPRFPLKRNRRWWWLNRPHEAAPRAPVARALIGISKLTIWTPTASLIAIGADYPAASIAAMRPAVSGAARVGLVHAAAVAAEKRSPSSRHRQP